MIPPKAHTPSRGSCSPKTPSLAPTPPHDVWSQSRPWEHWVTPCQTGGGLRAAQFSQPPPNLGQPLAGLWAHRFSTGGHPSSLAPNPLHPPGVSYHPPPRTT